ncbi:tol-pal system protein YbgF, partial [Achromobacter xylosoxidans]
MRDYVLSLRPLMAATGLVLAALAAPAHAFSDDEARKAILDLRQQVQQQNEQSQRAKLQLADQIQALQQEVAQLRDQLELVSRQQPSANKPGGAAGGAPPPGAP